MRLTDALGGFVNGDAEAEGLGRKPGIPILLPCALVLWAADASAYALFETTSAADVRLGLLACLVALAVSGIAIIVFRKAPLLLLAFLLLGAALGSFASYSYHQSVEQLPTGSLDVTLELTGDERSSAFGSSCSAKCQLPDGSSIGAIAYFSEFNGFLNGTQLACQAKVAPFPEDGFSRGYYADQVAKVTVSEFHALEETSPLGMLRAVRKQAIDVIAEHAGDQTGLLQALVCGYRETLQASGTYEEFKVCGLAHLVAVSGAHLAIVTMVLGWALKMLRAPRRIVLGCSLAFILCYLAFSGIPISAIRAAIMVFIALLAGVAKRRNATLNSLAACIVAFMVASPASCVSVSLFLSAGSTLGIVLFTPLFASWMDGFPKLLKGAVGEPVGMTLASNIATMPFSAALFGMVPVLCVLSNIAATPLFTVGCVGGLGLTIIACACPALASAAIGLASLAVAPLSWLSATIANLPFATMDAELPVIPMIAASCVMALTLWLAWPKVPTWVCGSALVLAAAAYSFVAFLAPPVAGDQIVMLDVGQGDAFVLQSKGQTLLIDTGNEDAKLRDALAFAGIRSIDTVAITHPDDDHCASLDSLGPSFGITSFLCAKPMTECPCDKCEGLLGDARAMVGEQGLCPVSPGDSIRIGNFDVRVLWPSEYQDEGGNADSLCLLAELDCNEDGIVDWRAIFTGDAESEQLNEILSQDNIGSIDILKVGHHGSRVSLDEACASALRPEVALISVGAGNSYGHPSVEALSLLEECGTRILRTDESGTVVLGFTADEMTIPRQSK